MVDDACRILRAHHDQTLVDKFGPIALEDVRDRMIDAVWKRSTINKQIARLVRMFKWDVSKEIVDPSTLHKLQ